MMPTDAIKLGIDGRISLYKLAVSTKIRTLITRVPIYFLESVDIMYQCPVLSFRYGDSVCLRELLTYCDSVV